MRGTIAWRYDLLSPDEQTIFRRLAVFVGGFTLEAAEAVTDAAGRRGIDAFEGVASLADNSLLRREAGPDGEPRYLMLETVREFGLDRLAASGEAAALRGHHAAYFLALAERALPAYGTADEAGWYRRLDAEQPNLRAALAWAAEQDAAEVLLRLSVAIALSGYWENHSSTRDGYGWLERAVAATADLPAALHGKRAVLLVATAREAIWRGGIASAAALLDEALALARDAGDAWADAWAAQGLGQIAILEGDPDRAEARVGEALTRWRELAEPTRVWEALYLLGYAVAVRGDNGTAEDRFAEALGVARAGGSDAAIGVVLEALGTCARERGDQRRAAALFAESLTLLQDRDDPLVAANCLKSLGGVAAAVGRAEQAARLFGAAATLWDRYGFDQPPVEQSRLERAIAPARAALPAAAFAAAWEAGRALPLADAVAEALAVADAVAAPLPPEPVPRHGLTPRELEVLRLVAGGRSNREVADLLSLSERTVENHVLHVLTKLDLPSRTAAAGWAIRNGLA